MMNERNLDDYLDLQSITNRYPQFTEGQLRWIVVRRYELGIAESIKRVGRRLYFHIPSFLNFIESQKA